VVIKVVTGKAVIIATNAAASEAPIKMADASSESAKAAVAHTYRVTAEAAAKVSSASTEMATAAEAAVATTAAMSEGHCAGRHRRRADRYRCGECEYLSVHRSLSTFQSPRLNRFGELNARARVSPNY
jgi:hypothetical protein